MQRVARAEVRVAGTRIGAIGQGSLVFVCAEPDDDDAIADKLVDRLLRLRIFPDAAGKMNRSLIEVNGGLLVVSQFTLAADVSSGHRPSFSGVAPAARARALYERVVAAARARHPKVESGAFGADMQVELVNDGPVTIPVYLR